MDRNLERALRSTYLIISCCDLRSPTLTTHKAYAYAKYTTRPHTHHTTRPHTYHTTRKAYAKHTQSTPHASKRKAHHTQANAKHTTLLYELLIKTHRLDGATRDDRPRQVDRACQA
jgi:hypothetical protein